MGRYKVDKSTGGLIKIESPMIGATDAAAGTEGIVPAPEAGEQNKFLKGDGTWDIADTNFTGTKTQWNKLSLKEKRKYRAADILPEYSIVYNPNGGNGIPVVDNKALGDNIIIQDNNFTHDNEVSEQWEENNGYRYHPVYPVLFNNWNTDEEGEGNTYYPNNDYADNNNLNLYAQWEEDTTSEVERDSEQYYLTVHNGEHIVSVSGEDWYDKDTEATADGVPAAPIIADNYTIDPNDSGHRYKQATVYTSIPQNNILMDEPKAVTIEANVDDTQIANEQYYLTVNTDAHVVSATPSNWYDKNSEVEIIATAETGYQIVSGTGMVLVNEAKIINIETESTALKFSSDSSFNLSVATPGWDGIIEYSLDNGNTWVTWDGSQLSGTVNQSIYVRGIGNTVITGDDRPSWNFTGKYCTGNIETLLDYQTVIQRQHPTMGDYCYSHMFDGRTSLITAPSLPATTLTKACYSRMFQGCTSLTTAPELPATTLVRTCYSYMFNGCTSLTTTPQLPATTLAVSCYNCMFCGCTGLTAVPSLPATTLADSCYNGMFSDCTSLITASKLPATTLVYSCYYHMFKGCTSFKLSTTSSDIYKYEYRIPTLGTGTIATNALTDMFTNTGGTFIGTPTINTIYYTDHQPI